MSKFQKFVERLRAEGYSKKSADSIAAAEGDKKYGVEAMARKSAQAREKHEAQRFL
jgi:hypothetical protein